MQNNPTRSGLSRWLLSAGKISARFRNCNIALFSLAFLMMVVTISAAFYAIIRQVSAEYAGTYAVSSANALSAFC
jgi:hypothetical protein